MATSNRKPSDRPPVAHENLHLQLQQLQQHLSQEKRTRWSRDLPFEELLFDRWTRARTLGFGEDTSIYQSSYVYGDVSVGPQTWIGPFTLLDGSGGLAIGRNCSISAGVQIYSHNTVRWALSGGETPYERRPVRIGDCCFIGPHSVIRDGVTIGDHVVVGAHSFVNREVPPFTIVAGAPARPIGRVELDGEAVHLHYFDGHDGSHLGGPA